MPLAVACSPPPCGSRGGVSPRWKLIAGGSRCSALPNPMKNAGGPWLVAARQRHRCEQRADPASGCPTGASHLDCRAAFKRCLPQHYFNWPVNHPADPQFSALLRSWISNPDFTPLRTQLRGSARVVLVTDKPDAPLEEWLDNVQRAEAPGSFAVPSAHLSPMPVDALSGE
jgi:hypothetical protein